MTPTPHLHEPETVRPPAVAGTFYPADPNELAGEIDEMLRAAAADLPATVPPPVALIAPHAGYVYSGPVAASAYARLARSGQLANNTRLPLNGPDNLKRNATQSCWCVVRHRVWDCSHQIRHD